MEIIQCPARLVTLAENSIAVTEQEVACFCELSLTAATIEQSHLQLLLKVLDLQAQRSLIVWEKMKNTLFLF